MPPNLLHLVSEQTMQNLLPLLALRPKTVVQVRSRDDRFRQAAEHLKNAVATIRNTAAYRDLAPEFFDIVIRAFLITTWVVQGWAAYAQPFRNLGFDEANTNTTQFFISSDPSLPRPQGVGPPEDLVPGWQLFNGDNLVTFVGYNLLRTNVSWFTLITKALDRNRVQGAYGLHLTYLSATSPGGLRLCQRGDIPTNAAILTFSTYGDDWLVTANRTRLFPSTVDFAQPLPKISFDISAFAGKNVELQLLLAQDSGMIDSVAFEPAPVQVTQVSTSGNSLMLSWSAGTGPYLVQEKFRLADTNWINVLTTSNMTATVARVGEAGFFRIADTMTTMRVAVLATQQRLSGQSSFNHFDNHFSNQ